MEENKKRVIRSFAMLMMTLVFVIMNEVKDLLVFRLQRNIIYKSIIYKMLFMVWFIIDDSK